MDYPNPAKRGKPIPGGETEEEYRRVMKKIMEGLTKDNLETILFLCKDHIPVGREINSAMQLLNYLEGRDIVSKDSAVFIAEVMHIIRRMDLLKLIPCIKNKKHFEKEYLGFSYSQFSNYRVLTVKLQEELSQSDFEIFRYQCGQHLHIRSIDNAVNVLSLLRSLEEEDVISLDDYEDLIKILECIDNVKPLKMFQRLLEGDETVAVPTEKQQQRQVQSSEAIFPDRRYVPEHTSPPPAYDTTRRVEEMPYMTDPPPYMTQTTPQRPHQSGLKWYTDPNTTNAKVHDEGRPVSYDFSNQGVSWRTQPGKCFDESEQTDTKYVESTSRPEYSGMPFSSMPAQRTDYSRHYSDTAFQSMPQGGYGTQRPYEEVFFQPRTMHPVSSYPQDMRHIATGYGYPDMQRRYLIRSQTSRDSAQTLAFHQHYADPRIMPSQRQVVPTNMPVIPPADHTKDSTALQEDFGSLSMKTDEFWTHEFSKAVESGGLIPDGEETYLNKAIANNSETPPLDTKPEAPPNPQYEQEMEELRKRNQELEELLNMQKNVGSYKMSSSPVGLCVLINNVEFVKNRMYKEHGRRKMLNENAENNIKHELPRLDLTDRIGSNVDACKLEKLFECFDFEVQRHDDLDGRGMKRVLTEAATADHSNYDCFVLIILSHGDSGCVFGVDGFAVKTVDIQKPFQSDNCPALANKPKILIFQACQGVKAMPAVAPMADVTHDGPQPEYLADHSTPSKADFLIAHSTVPGYISYRSKVEGSYFVMEIVKIFKRNFEHQDLLSMMIMVNDEVGKYSHKQVPMPVPTLRKKVFFHLKEGCSLDDIEDGIIGEYHEYDDSESEVLGAVGGSACASPPESISTSTQESGEQEH